MSIFETCCPECRSEDWEYQPLVLDLMADGIKKLVRENPPIDKNPGGEG